MPKGKRLAITLSKTDEATLRMWANARTVERRMAERAQVILLSAQGVPVREIMRRTGLSWGACCKWRGRFVESGLDGLKDRPRKGRPPSIPLEQRIRVLEKATERPPDGSTRWSVRRLARVTGLSHSTVHRILREGDLKPHKTKYWCGRSPDPEFAAKQAAIIGLYLNPPTNALVICVDEKTNIQALDRRQPELPLKKGKVRRLTATYKRNGTTCLLAALTVHDGKVIGRCVDKNNHEAFLAFLKHIYRKFPHVQIHIILDNLSVHKHKKIKEWVSRRKRLTLHFTPTYASWLNQIEIWFNIFTRDVLKDGIWPSKQALVRQIMDYIKHYSAERAHPFKWVYPGSANLRHENVVSSGT